MQFSSKFNQNFINFSLDNVHHSLTNFLKIRLIFVKLSCCEANTGTQTHISTYANADANITSWRLYNKLFFVAFLQIRLVSIIFKLPSMPTLCFPMLWLTHWTDEGQLNKFTQKVNKTRTFIIHNRSTDTIVCMYNMEYLKVNLRLAFYHLSSFIDDIVKLISNSFKEQRQR